VTDDDGLSDNRPVVATFDLANVRPPAQ